jgi:phospholipase/carboxylesterase
MNRIQQLVDEELNRSLLASVPALGLADASEPRIELDDCHCIFSPKHYERNYAYPLVVWLHGPQDDERQVTRVMPHVSDRNYVAVGPRGTVPAVAPSVGFCWEQEAEQIAGAERRVMAAVAAVRSWLNVAPSHIFLAGYGDGGTMAYRIAMNRPDKFAGVLSFGGAFPSTLGPLANYHAARGMKIFLAAGQEAETYSQSDVSRDLRLFHSAGMAVCLRLYPCGDEVTTTMLSDMNRWIMEQVAPQPAVPNPCSPRSRGR